MPLRSFGQLSRRLAIVATFGLGVPLAAQQTTVNVTVLDGTAGGPVDQAQVQVAGTNLGGITNGEGRLVLRGVPAGSQVIRVLRVGYAEGKQTVVVAAGQSTDVTIRLTTVAVSLAPVVTTATGETRRVEIGNSVANIDAARLTEIAPVTNVGDLLNSRTAGVTVTSGIQTGAGMRVRIRGQNSLNLSNDPIYVIDGVRLNSAPNSSRLFTGGAQPNRVGDLNPEEIESIEVVKGPSAATLYGTDAANGVVVITTKKGRVGSARWNVYGEGGAIRDRNAYPTAYTIFGKRTGQTAPAPLNFCNNTRLALNECTVDSVATLNVFDEPDLTPLGMGYRYQAGAQVSGGTEMIRYFVAGEREDETGVLELPQFEKDRLKATNTPVRPWVMRPNTLGKTSVRANLNGSLSSQLDMAVTTNFIRASTLFSQESNATAGLGSQIFGGPGCLPCAPDRTVSGTGTPLNGYRAWTPAYTWEEKVGQRVNRYIASTTANWRPTNWLQTRATVGNDFASRVDDNFAYRGEGAPLTATYRDGFKFNSRTDLNNFTTDIAATATVTPRPWLNLKTSAGAQYIDTRSELGETGGTDLPPGAQTATAAANPSATELTTIQKTLGLFLEQSVAINDRLFLAAAVRSDQNSAFGSNFQNVVYPKASVSWLMSEEGFFPRSSWLNSLRLRAAYGASGVQPGPNDALTSLAAITANVRGTDTPAVWSGALGNTDLKPEFSAEFEGGFEAKLLADRLTLEVTGYRRRTKDALINAIVAPSLGTGSTSTQASTTIRQNLGELENKGWEMLASAQVIDRRSIGFDVTFNASTNTNTLISLGGTPKQVNVTTQVREGYPLFGFWARAIEGYRDRNNDGFITYNADPNLSEITIGDTATFRGYTQPRHIATLTSGLELFSRRLRVSGMLDYRGGHKWYNNTERIRCQSRQNCSGLMNPEATLEDQAMVVALRDHPSRTLDGFFQDGTFLRFREVSASYTLSNDWARRLTRARSVSVVATARNIAHWTKYRGVDPETDRLSGVTTAAGADVPEEFQTLGPPSYFVFRVNLGF